MEQVLQTILEEIKGVKKEIQETKTELCSEIQQSEKGLREEMQEMKQELREEMQEIKQELLSEMDKRFTKQSKEIAQELQQIIIQQQRRDSKFEKRLIKLEKEKKEILLDIRKMQTESKGFEYRISKIEDEQKLEKVG